VLTAYAVVVAQQDPNSILGVDPWALGIGGVLFLLVASGRLIVATFVYDREKARADRMESELARLNSAVLDKHGQVLADAASALRESTALTREVQAELRAQYRKGA